MALSTKQKKDATMLSKVVSDENKAKLKLLKLPLNVYACPACERVYKNKKKAHSYEFYGQTHVDCHACGDEIMQGAWQLVKFSGWEDWDVI